MVVQKYGKLFLIAVAAFFALWIGKSIVTYFTYNVEPVVSIVGIEQDKSYKGEVDCSVCADNKYKIDFVSVLIDGKILPDFRLKSIKAKSFKLPVRINTTNLSDGRHSIEVKSCDASYHANKSVNKVDFYVDNKPLKAAFLQQDYKVNQGHTLQPKIQLNKHVASAKVTVFSQEYECYPESEHSTVYECFIPIDCEQSPDEYLISFEIMDKVGNTAKQASTVKINAIEFPRQKGFHVAQEKLDDEKEVSMNNRILAEALDKWLLDSPKKKLWKGRFEAPTVVKRLSTPFGEIRITPEKGRYLHRAVDIVNTPKSVVWACQNGKVIIKDRYLMTGNTVVIDHGLGVFTKYFHLDDFSDVEVGDLIKKGEPVGRLGMTGYANGYHLHWELTVNNVPVEPFEWTKKVF